MSIMISSTLPRLSPAELRTESPASVLADKTRRYVLSESVFLILFSCIRNAPMLLKLAPLMPYPSIFKCVCHIRTETTTMVNEECRTAGNMARTESPGGYFCPPDGRGDVIV